MTNVEHVSVGFHVHTDTFTSSEGRSVSDFSRGSAPRDVSERCGCDGLRKSRGNTRRRVTNTRHLDVEVTCPKTRHIETILLFFIVVFCFS